ncbi:MAG: O-antigen ligase family protein [Verrucomicrobiia bacterium]
MSKRTENTSSSFGNNPDTPYGKISTLTTGLFFGLVFAKGGNPIIFADKIEPPSNLIELVFQPFPFSWFYWLLAIIVLLNLFNRVKLRSFKISLILFLPLLWFVWQIFASFTTIDSKLTSQTLTHFGACVICFYVGVLNKKEFEKFNTLLFTGIFLGFLWTIANGFEQHFGGLETIRQNFEKTLQQLPAGQRTQFDTYEFRVKILSNRIFSTFIYPNAFAGGLLLLTPQVLYFLYSYGVKTAKALTVRIAIFASVAASSLLCLYWTGSKSGFIIAAIVGSLWFLQSDFSKKIKILSVIGLILFAGAFVLIKYSDYFHSGARSLGARFDYWNAAIKTSLTHPIFGTGPGTFAIAYRKIKPPEAEMARLAHNDYLQQASDSGVLGMFLFLIFIGSVLIRGFKAASINKPLFYYWLGLCACCLHSFVEFHLYIPALSYQAFAIAGVLSTFETSPNGKNLLDRD